MNTVTLRAEDWERVKKALNDIDCNCYYAHDHANQECNLNIAKAALEIQPLTDNEIVLSKDCPPKHIYIMNKENYETMKNKSKPAESGDHNPKEKLTMNTKYPDNESGEKDYCPIHKLEICTVYGINSVMFVCGGCIADKEKKSQGSGENADIAHTIIYKNTDFNKLPVGIPSHLIGEIIKVLDAKDAQRSDAEEELQKIKEDILWATSSEPCLPHRTETGVKVWEALGSDVSDDLSEILAIALPWIERCPADGLELQKEMLIKQIEEALASRSKGIEL